MQSGGHTGSLVERLRQLCCWNVNTLRHDQDVTDVQMEHARLVRWTVLLLLLGGDTIGGMAIELIFVPTHQYGLAARPEGCFFGTHPVV